MINKNLLNWEELDNLRNGALYLFIICEGFLTDHNVTMQAAYDAVIKGLQDYHCYGTSENAPSLTHSKLTFCVEIRILSWKCRLI